MPPKFALSPLPDDPEAEEESHHMNREVRTPETEEATTPRSSEESWAIEINHQDGDEDEPVLLSADEIVRCMKIKYSVDRMISNANGWVQRISMSMAMAARLGTQWVLDMEGMKKALEDAQAFEIELAMIASSIDPVGPLHPYMRPRDRATLEEEFESIMKKFKSIGPMMEHFADAPPASEHVEHAKRMRIDEE